MKYMIYLPPSINQCMFVGKSMEVAPPHSKTSRDALVVCMYIVNPLISYTVGTQFIYYFRGKLGIVIFQNDSTVLDYKYIYQFICSLGMRYFGVMDSQTFPIYEQFH